MAAAARAPVNSAAHTVQLVQSIDTIWILSVVHGNTGIGVLFDLKLTVPTSDAKILDQVNAVLESVNVLIIQGLCVLIIQGILVNNSCPDVHAPLAKERLVF